MSSNYARLTVKAITTLRDVDVVEEELIRFTRHPLLTNLTACGGAEDIHLWKYEVLQQQAVTLEQLRKVDGAVEYILDRIDTEDVPDLCDYIEARMEESE